MNTVFLIVIIILSLQINDQVLNDSYFTGNTGFL